MRLPGKIEFAQDGEYLSFGWKESSNATHYDLKVLGEDYDLTKTRSGIKYIKQGVAYEVKVRAVREYNGEEYYSDWVSASYTVPEIKYEDIRWGSAIFLSADQAVAWANTMGYTVTRVEDGDITVVRISKPDPENTGALNKLGTIFGALVEGFVDGAASQISADYSSAETIINNYLESEGMQDYLDTEKENVAYTGMVSAVANGWSAAWSSRDICYEYYYSDTMKSPYLGTCYWLKNNRENFDQEFSYEKDKDGRFIVDSKTFGERYYFSINEIEDGGLHKWLAIISKH